MVEKVSIYFEVHQPFRLRPFNLLGGGGYFDGRLNKAHLLRAAQRCYLPANALLRRLALRHGNRFRVAFSLTGTFLEQCSRYAPEVIESFQELHDTGAVEILGETDYHSLACVFSPDELEAQILSHRSRMERLFGVTPKVFRNTELIYRDDLAPIVESLGFCGVITEGLESILRGRQPHHLFRASRGRLGVLLKDHVLSDDIAFRFADRTWSGWPLTAEAFVDRLRRAQGEHVNLCLDYETLGEHHAPDSGILTLLRQIVELFLQTPAARFVSPGQILDLFESGEVYRAPAFISWADEARDLSAWLGNEMQRSAARALYGMEPGLKALGDGELIRIWRLLQTSDHLYYMSTKGAADGGVHAYFSPFPSPHDAFACFMNVIHDLKRRLARAGTTPPAAPAST